MQDLKIVYVVILYAKLYLQVQTSNKLLMQKWRKSCKSIQIKNKNIKDVWNLDYSLNNSGYASKFYLTTELV